MSEKLERFVMLSTERVLLRLHVEAVWGVQLPPLANNDCELLATSYQPPWQLYAAHIANARIHIWRPDVSMREREALRLLVDDALAFSHVPSFLAGISREVAFSFTASPDLDLVSAQSIARPLGRQDLSLVELFQPSSNLFDSAKGPFIGVIEADRLLCLAHSSRRTAAACELGIDTLPSARRKGYALAATVLWTHFIRQEGLVPLYSAFAENTASLNLAVRAGYRAFAHGATLDREQEVLEKK